MKPVGLIDPHTQRRPHAVVQLRPENQSLSAYNLVGFQTKLKYGEQTKVFRLIPALKNAEFLRLGSIHRNTYICSPRLLNTDCSLKIQPPSLQKTPKIFFAGQITGVEGYLESTAGGLLAAMSITHYLQNQPFTPPPVQTMLGALLRYLVQSDADHFQPMNCNFSVFRHEDFKLESTGKKHDKDRVRQQMASQSQIYLSQWISESKVIKT
jgi:methylenetetrahydrofolate--tRNA-(uracil-5-)-methyltransferase